jgi:hypothetical protein
MVSMPLPAASETTIVMGRDGYSSAPASALASRQDNIKQDNIKQDNIKRGNFQDAFEVMTCSPTSNGDSTKTAGHRKR